MKGYAFGCEDAGVIDPERVNQRGLDRRVEEADGRLARVAAGDGRCRTETAG